MDDKSLSVKKQYENNEITGRIYLQLCNLEVNTILHDDGVFFSHAFSVMHKLNATMYHKENYKRIEANRHREAKNALRKGNYIPQEELALIFELEAFLFQVKSSLDMLAKLLIPVVGKDTVHTQTYGDKGEKIIKGLEQYKAKKDVNIKAVDNLITLMRYDKDCWLEMVVNIRDELNHRKGLRNYIFVPVELPNGTRVIKKPKFKRMNAVEFLELICANNIQFQQDFMAVAIAIKSPLPLISIPPEVGKEKFNCDIGRYVKYGWGMPKKNNDMTE